MLLDFLLNDGTLVHLSTAARTELLALALEWSAKWLSIIKVIKTHCITSAGPPLPYDTEINGIVFKEVSAAVALGVGVVRGCLFDTKHATSLITRVSSRVLDLVCSGVSNGHLRIDVLVFIYKVSAFSLLIRSLSTTSFRNCSIARLDKAQENFVRLILDLPDSVYGPTAIDEVGLPRVSLMCIRTQSNLLSLHRIHSNKLDSITPKMHNWPRTTDGLTTFDLIERSLFSLGSACPALDFLSLTYLQTKHPIKRRVMCTQMREWDVLSGCNPSKYHLTHRTKPCWEIEPYLINIPPKQVKALNFMRARLGVPFSLFPTDVVC